MLARTVIQQQRGHEAGHYQELPASKLGGDSTDEELDPKDVRIERVPLLGEKVIIDDKDAVYVVIFKRQTKGHGRSVNHEEEREQPKEDWVKIFGSKEKPPDVLRRGAVLEGVYQEAVRAKVLQLLQKSGLKAKSTVSLDNEETFLKLAVDARGRLLRKLAEAFQYRMPFTEESYKDEERFGTYPGGRPMTNGNGDLVLAYQEFSEDKASKLQPFRQIDEVRLITMQINSCFSLAELVKQKVVSKHFPGAQFDRVLELHNEWASCHNCPTLPDKLNDERVRSYFGEEIAFFFRYFAMYTRTLGLLAVVALGLSIIVHMPGLGITLDQKDRFNTLFGVYLVLWETTFHKIHQADTSRMIQKWGMEGSEHMEEVLSTYDPGLEGTSKLRARKTATTAVVVLYMVMFVVAVIKLNLWLPTQTQMIQWLNPYIQTAAIKILSFTWRKIAFHLVTWQNHRTQSRWNEALIVNVSIVKLFVALFPFFYYAFLMDALHPYCKPSLREAAVEVYQHRRVTGLNLPPFDNPANITEEQLEFLEGHYYIKNDEFCIYGCYPVKCDPHCETNCMLALQRNLLTFYVIHLGTIILFLLVPIFLTLWAVHKEMQKVRQRRGGEVRYYSFIELQAKCHEQAPYEFTAWGGSYVEDFLELAVSYSLMACFGLCKPLMSFIGFLCLVLEYRLLAFRMTNVTCRPQPRGAKGIGLWRDVFEIISLMSLTCNVGLVVIQMLPVRKQPLWKKVGIFIIAEKGLLFLRTLVSYLLPSTPDDVILIEDFNAEFKKKFVKQKKCSERERHSYGQVDVGLARATCASARRTSGSDSGASSDESGCC